VVCIYIDIYRYIYMSMELGLDMSVWVCLVIFDLIYRYVSYRYAYPLEPHTSSQGQREHKTPPTHAYIIQTLSHLRTRTHYHLRCPAIVTPPCPPLPPPPLLPGQDQNQTNQTAIQNVDWNTETGHMTHSERGDMTDTTHIVTRCEEERRQG